jgi:amidase
MFMNTKFDEEWLVHATLSDIQTKLECGDITSQQLVLLYMERIATFDQAGMKINSILEMNPDAIFLAEALDKERSTSGARGPLHGIPILLKDNIDTGDKMHTSAGSLALADHRAAQDAFLAAKLRKAGAILLGKTNMTEWANFMTDGMPAGFSSRGGQVLNPYGPGTCFIGGSSSGSAAAVACSFAAGAIGTETSGSILSPASHNSVVGIKPTVGLVSRTGVIPITYTQDTAGPMAKTVRDAALLLGALTGVDEKDPATWRSASQAHVDYSAFLRRDGLRGKRIGVPRDDVYFNELNEEEKVLMERVIETLRAEGAIVVDNIAIPSAREKWDYAILIYEFKSALNQYLETLPAHHAIHSLRDVIACNEVHAESALQYGQVILQEAESLSGTLREPEYLRSRARNLQLSRTEGIDYALQQDGLDALFFAGEQGADLAARAGYPSITVPAGYTSQGHPIGATFTSTAYREPVLIEIAYSYEQASRLRVAPQFEKHRTE